MDPGLVDAPHPPCPRGGGGGGGASIVVLLYRGQRCRILHVPLKARNCGGWDKIRKVQDKVYTE